MRVFLTVLIFVISNSNLSVFSQNNKELDLFECIKIASDSSLQSFIAENYYKSGYWEYRSYKAERLPLLSLKLTPMHYNRNIVRRYDFLENIDIYRKQQSLYSSGGLTLSQNIDLTGGTFFIDSELGWIKNYGENKNEQFNTIPIRIGYSQALFGFNRFKWERKIEPLKFEKVKKQFLYKQQQIAENTVQHFFSYMQAQNEYELVLENVFSTDSLYRIGLERQRMSTISEADVLTLKLDKINALNTLKNIELDLKDTRSTFFTFLNLDDGDSYSLKLPENINDISVPIARALVYIQNNNPDYLTYIQEVLEAEREVDRNRKSVFDANISASIGFNQVSDNFSGAYRKPLQQDIITVSLTIPILDWGMKKGQINMAKSNLDVTKLSVQQMKRNLERELVSAIDNFNKQKELFNSVHEVLALANEAYRINKKRFIVGKTDISNLTLSLNRYKEAQRNYINTLKYYWLSYFKIRKLTLYDFEQQKDIAELFNNRLSIL